MRRLQWTLLLLASGLAVSVALLASRALEGVAFEKAARHETVATRVFDEMERALSRFLEAEEARPFESYEAIESSAPAQREDAPFVVGYFQIDPDGDLHTTRHGTRSAGAGAAAADADLAAATKLLPPARAEVRSDRVQRIVEPVWEGEGADQQVRVASPEERPAPGKTKRLAPAPPGSPEQRTRAKAPKREALAIESKKDSTEEREANAYEVLQSFNMASSDRAARQKSVAIAKSRRPRPAAARPSLKADDSFAGARAPSALSESVALRRDLVEEPRELGAASFPALAERDIPAGLLEDELVGLSLDPMVGRASGAQHLLLYRTVVVGEQGYRQGLVLDRDGLGSWLEERVLAASARLAQSTRFWFFGEGQEVRYDAPPRSLVYEHRFAEPFDAFSVVLALAPLPGVASTASIYALVALVIGVATLGLFAVYRMAYVTLQYAERRSNFVSAVSHELKTPLTAIRMYGEMLRDGVASDEAKRKSYYEIITDESERLSRLINNVLEFSRIERGGSDVSLTVGAIGPVLEEAARTLRPHAERAGFTLRVEIGPDLPALRFDRDGVVQLLFNLVDNALKYAHAAEHKEIVVECRNADQGVRLSVRDFGPGVARQHLSKLFEPFYRGQDEMTRSARGTGIGLALVKDIAERMNAAASAANAPGGGFVVSIDFQPAAP
jgi:signal transduction histidine kinase